MSLINKLNQLITVDSCKIQLVIPKPSIQQGNYVTGQIKIFSNKKVNRIKEVKMSLFAEYFTENMEKQELLLYTLPIYDQFILYPHDEKIMSFQFPIYISSLITSANIIFHLKCEMLVHKGLPAIDYHQIHILPSLELQEILHTIQYDLECEPTYQSGYYTNYGQIFDYYCKGYYQSIGIEQITFIFILDDTSLNVKLMLKMKNGQCFRNKCSWIRKIYQNYNGHIDKEQFKKLINEVIYNQIGYKF